MDGSVVLGGNTVDASALALPRARWLAETVGSGCLDYVRLIECRQFPAEPTGSGAELILIEVEVERPQAFVNPIQRFEQLAIAFLPRDESYPLVLSLRKTFPRVKHLNFGSSEFPRDLCLYEEPWTDVQVRWTPTNCIERIRSWLAEQACGTLHRDDQSLEGIFPRSKYQIILPADLFANTSVGAFEQLHVVILANIDACTVFYCTRAGNGKSNTERANVVALAVATQSQEHGTIRYIPKTLKELDAILQGASVKLIDSLRVLLRDIDEARRDCRLLILAAFPLKRETDTPVEVTDVVAFVSVSTLKEIGVDLGVWCEHGGKLAWHVGPAPENAGDMTEIDLASPHFDLTRDKAAQAASVAPSSMPIAAVGTGALGSQVIMNLQRGGFGQFALIDEDILFPHNLARHALARQHVGFSKAEGLALELEGLYSDTKVTWTCANVLRPGGAKETMADVFKNSAIILDQAASVAVARHLTHGIESDARRMSLFLNLRGTDLVAIAEDVKRTTKLDCLEMQYYREVAHNPSLADHLKRPDSRIRYARSCRDVTAALPTELVAMHAAIGARAVRALSEADTAAIRIWKANPESLAVNVIEIAPAGFHSTKVGDWTIFVSEHVLQALATQRQEKLPKETGGVLVGAFDMPHRIVYIVDTLLSPPDSKEWPTLYIRGSKGLYARVEEIQARTLNQLEYVGEWHSHPDRCPCDPSEDDKKVFAWLTGHMDSAGLPALMVIAGDRGRSAWYLGQMVKGRAWELRK